MEIFTIGGFSEVGKNMTAIRVDDNIVICDMGIYLPELIDFEEEGGKRENLTREGLISLGAIPDDSIIKDIKNKVKAIVLSHCHLDHIAAVPYLASRYNCPIIGTPYTIEVLKSILRDEKIRIKNEIKSLNPNSKLKINENLEIELIHITHSTLQASLIAVHTKEGTAIYANDFKFDNHPILIKKPNYKRLKELKGQVKVLIVESLYADVEGKTPSEKVAKEMLKDVMLGISSKNNTIFVTTFASHIPRLKSVIEFSKKMNRKTIILGRSMAKYIGAAEKLNLIHFSKDAEIISFRRKVKDELHKIEKSKHNYVVICTGGQGEPGSILTSITTGEIKFRFDKNDIIIFSNRVIPAEINIANRARLEKKLRDKGVRIFKNIHTSGHSSKEDLRDLIEMLKPEHIIPAHGELKMLVSLGELAKEIGYKTENIHIQSNGQKLII